MRSVFLIIVFFTVFQLLVVREIYCRSVEESGKLSYDQITRLENFGKALKEKLSPEIDPCENFHGYVCSKTNQSRSVVPTREKIPEILENYLSKTEELSDAELKLKHNFQTCKKTTVDDANKFIKEFNFPDSIGGWPVFNSNWKPDKFNLQSAIAELKAYSISVVIDQSFDVAQKNLKKFLFIEVEDFSLVKNNSTRKKVVDKLTKLGIENMDEVIADSELLERECGEVISAAKPEDEQEVETDFSGLKTQIPEIDWDRRMEIILGNKLRDDYPVLIRGSEVIRKVLEKISKTKPKIVANYFFLNFAYRLPLIEDSEINKVCIRYAVDGYDLVVGGIYLKEYFTDKNRPVLSQMIYSVMKILQQSFDILKGISANGIAEYVEQQLNKEYLPIFTEDNLQKEYENIELDPNNFYKNLYALWRHQKRMTIRRLYLSETKRLELMEYFFPRFLSFNLHAAKNQPSAVVYDAMALQLIGDIANDLCYKYINDSVRECLKKQLNPIELKDREISFLMAANIFTKGYFDWANKNQELIGAEDELLREYDLTSKKVLFIRIMELGCMTQEQDKIKRTSSTFWNVPEFSETFNCPSGSQMNPVDRCKII